MNTSTIVAGGPSDFMTVRSLVVRGSQFEIGRALAMEARRHGWGPEEAEPTVNRARRTWFERNWPQQSARLDGVAAALGSARFYLGDHAGTARYQNAG
jgi:hypothetical protein